MNDGIGWLPDLYNFMRMTNGVQERRCLQNSTLKFAVWIWCEEISTKWLMRRARPNRCRDSARGAARFVQAQRSRRIARPQIPKLLAGNAEQVLLSLAGNTDAEN